MKKKIEYKKDLVFDGEKMKIGEVFPGFLFPSPEELIGKEKTVRVTLDLDEPALKFFKKQAKAHKASYQRMIRNLVSSYASAHIQH